MFEGSDARIPALDSVQGARYSNKHEREAAIVMKSSPGPARGKSKFPPKAGAKATSGASETTSIKGRTAVQVAVVVSSGNPRVAQADDEPASGLIDQRIRVAHDCGHLRCELIDRSCSLATGRSRGCRPGMASKSVAPEVFEEVRALLGLVDPDVRDERIQGAAVRLAEIIRREARDDRHLLAHARIDEPELAPALARLCVRRR